MHISVDAVNVMAAHQPVVLTCVHCGGRIETELDFNKEIFISRTQGANIKICKFVRGVFYVFDTVPNFAKPSLTLVCSYVFT